MSEVCHQDDVVLIHDGVRPNITAETIRDNIAMAKAQGACVTAEKTVDTIVVSNDGTTLTSIPPRKFLWNVQTPQSFRYGVIHKAHLFYENALSKEAAQVPEITDDTGLVLYMEECLPEGQRIGICPGNPGNLKVTKPEDLRILLSILQKEEEASESGDLR